MRLSEILLETAGDSYTGWQLLDLIVNTYGHESYHIIDDALNEYLPGYGPDEDLTDPNQQKAKLKIINSALKEIGAKFKVGRITQKVTGVDDPDFNPDMEDDGDIIPIYHIIKIAGSDIAGPGGDTPEQKAEVIRKSRTSTNNMVKYGTPEKPPSAKIMQFKRGN